ncbi:MAG TPA: DNA polymerase Y family protein [Phycisphaerae bacterium]|nr:DNA polymerase Y family protein [Phycisphaerae bacterium]
MATTARQETVARCCAQCAATGVRPGMTVAEAKALCPAARVAPFDPDRSRQAMSLLAKWALRFSPTVAVDRHVSGRFADDVPEGLLLDVTGEAHLFGSEHLLLTEIATRLRDIGFTARLAIAPTVGAAWAAARFGPHPLAVVGEEQLQKAIESLPIAALRISPEIAAGLRQVGIERVCHLLNLQREDLLTRFGDELLLRLDQAMGRMTELIQPMRVAEPIAVQRVFEGASTQLEAVMITVQELLASLHEKLLERESGIRGVRVELNRVNLPPASRELVVGRATRDAKHVWNLLRPKVEQMHLGYGVEAVKLTAYWVERIRHRQMEAWETGEHQDTHDREYEALLDTLVNRWGDKRVLRAHAVASHVPEVARQFRPVREKVPLNAGVEPTDMLFLDRPSILLEHPEQAEVLFLQPDHPPAHMQWRGESHALTNGAGPERIATAWWGARLSSTRDYFKMQTEQGLWVWIFRELETGRWFVHGLWA